MRICSASDLMRRGYEHVSTTNFSEGAGHASAPAKGGAEALSPSSLSARPITASPSQGGGRSPSRSRPVFTDVFAEREVEARWCGGVPPEGNKWVFVRCSDEFMQALEERRHTHESGHLVEYRGRPVADIGTAFSNAAERAGLEYAVCPYDIRHLWITTMLDKQVEISAIAHLAGTSVRMIIKNYYEPHSSETEKAAALLPKLGMTQEAPLRLVRPVQMA